MEKVISLYFELRKKSESYGNLVATVFKVKSYEDPASFFAMAFNNTTLSLELLSYYNDTWAKVNTNHLSQTKIAESREQIAQRVILLQKMSFIETMSSFEFSAKKIVNNNKVKFGIFSSRVYLSAILKRCLEQGMIDELTFKQWIGVIRLRNSLVHNNGISEETANYQYPHTTINNIENKMSQGDLMMFGYLVDWVFDNAKKWVLDSQ